MYSVFQENINGFSHFPFSVNAILNLSFVSRHFELNVSRVEQEKRQDYDRETAWKRRTEERVC